MISCFYMDIDVTVSLGSGSTVGEGDTAMLDVLLSGADELECEITVTLSVKDGLASKYGVLE